MLLWNIIEDITLLYSLNSSNSIISSIGNSKLVGLSFFSSLITLLFYDDWVRCFLCFYYSGLSICETVSKLVSSKVLNSVRLLIDSSILISAIYFCSFLFYNFYFNLTYNFIISNFIGFTRFMITTAIFTTMSNPVTVIRDQPILY